MYRVEQKKGHKVARMFSLVSLGWCLAKQVLFSAQVCMYKQSSVTNPKSQHECYLSCITVLAYIISNISASIECDRDAESYNGLCGAAPNKGKPNKTWGTATVSKGVHQFPNSPNAEHAWIDHILCHEAERNGHGHKCYVTQGRIGSNLDSRFETNHVQIYSKIIYLLHIYMMYILEICWSSMERSPKSIVAADMSDLKCPVGLWCKDLFKGWKRQFLCLVCLYIALNELKLGLKWNKTETVTLGPDMLRYEDATLPALVMVILSYLWDRWMICRCVVY